MQNIQEQLATLLRKTEKAHAEFEEKGVLSYPWYHPKFGQDPPKPDWPTWYAHYMLSTGKLRDLFYPDNQGDT